LAVVVPAIASRRRARQSSSNVDGSSDGSSSIAGALCPDYPLMISRISVGHTEVFLELAFPAGFLFNDMTGSPKPCTDPVPVHVSVIVVSRCAFFSGELAHPMGTRSRPS
jgi:hypothetical protein